MQFAATNTTTWHGCRNMTDRRHQASRCRTALSSRSAATRHQAFDAPAATDGLRERGADLTVLEVEDYIARPKPNGYRSLHALVEVPVHLSDRVVPVTVELQIRHCRDGLLGQPRAHDLLEVPRRRPADAVARARAKPPKRPPVSTRRWNGCTRKPIRSQ